MITDQRAYLINAVLQNNQFLRFRAIKRHCYRIKQFHFNGEILPIWFPPNEPYAAVWPDGNSAASNVVFCNVTSLRTASRHWFGFFYITLNHNRIKFYQKY